jgi:hypothetical protein
MSVEATETPPSMRSVEQRVSEPPRAFAFRGRNCFSVETAGRSLLSLVTTKEPQNKMPALHSASRPNPFHERPRGKLLSVADAPSECE